MSAWLRRLALVGSSLLLSAVWSCQFTAQGKGLMQIGPSVTMEAVSSCQCCAFCHHSQPNCASFAYVASAQFCLLYSSVARYNTFETSPGVDYYIMPNRSLRGQFCNVDTDCQMEEDVCRAYICVQRSRNTITCLEIYRMGARRDGQYWGWIEGNTLPLWCNMSFGGFTRVLSSFGSGWTADNLLWRNGGQTPGQDGRGRPYSILRHANAVKRAAEGGYCQLLVESYTTRQEMTTEVFLVPKDVPIPAHSPIPMEPITTNLMKSVPWMPEEKQYNAHNDVVEGLSRTLLTMSKSPNSPWDVVVPPDVSNMTRIDISIRETTEEGPITGRWLGVFLSWTPHRLR